MKNFEFQSKLSLLLMSQLAHNRKKELPEIVLTHHLNSLLWSRNEITTSPALKDGTHNKVARFSLAQLTKMVKMYQITQKYTKQQYNISNGRKIDQMFIKYTNIFHCKTLQNLPNLDFWFENIPSGNPDPHLREFSSM
jgi:hypothetical protein